MIRFFAYLVIIVSSWGTQYGIANANTTIQCYKEYLDRYSAYDGSFVERYLNNGKPLIRLTISESEVLSFEDYRICGNGESLGEPNYRLYGWEDTVTLSKIILFCEDIQWEPEKRRGIRTTLEIDRYTGEIMIEQFGYSINNEDMNYPFTYHEIYGHCERAKSKF